MSYKTLEKDYYKALRNIAKSLSANKIISKTKLPYLLEDITLPRLRPSCHWIISAISGSGKTTVSRFFITAGFKKLRNVTTRTQRAEETGDDYIFVNDKIFVSWKKKGLLFHPHKRNNVWHAILKKDIAKLIKCNSLIYLDKSVSSSSKKEIYNRFKEEINDMKKSVKLPYVYLVNDSLKRVKKLLTETIKNSTI